MSNGIRRWLILVLAMTFMGCGKEGSPERAMGERETLRTRTDAARGRLWVLGLYEVRVYDSAKKRLVGKVVLPNWSVAQPVCAPDMALDRSGSAFISSNVQPKLWRIDADSFEVTEREIRLPERERWDVGFGALAFAPDGMLLALTTFGGSLWRVDFGHGSARIVEESTAFVNMCELTVQFLNELERRRKP